MSRLGEMYSQCRLGPSEDSLVLGRAVRDEVRENAPNPPSTFRLMVDGAFPLTLRVVNGMPFKLTGISRTYQPFSAISTLGISYVSNIRKPRIRN